MTELQRVIFNYEGTINKLLVDDKGVHRSDNVLRGAQCFN
jgi:hypothetical protein